MKVLTVYAHPNPASFCHAALEQFTKCRLPTPEVQPALLRLSPERLQFIPKEDEQGRYYEFKGVGQSSR
jgi:putative NADPH-quinone reductase